MAYLWLPKFKISVNLSAKEFRQDRLIESISQILNDVQVDPKYVTLELTERIAMVDEKETLLRLKQLKEYGIKLPLMTSVLDTLLLLIYQFFQSTH